MYQLTFVDVTQDVLDLAAGVAGDAAGFVGVVVDQAARDVVAAFVQNGDD